ncbi:phage tail domain-containing protein [Pseudobacillus badius]|uniref:phage tail domain-containing protein n=1 Tax=Bacillus badius TaxID=1455 RepID=UPI0007B3CDF5|nr:phage tail domain-containing protein [Bacillus badius]KZR58364.1 hypothetical protein A3781_17370 [Bacillus badius]
MEKSVFNFKVDKGNGDVMDLHSLDFWVESFRIGSHVPKHELAEIEGAHGMRSLGTTLGARKILSTIKVWSDKPGDFDLLRDQIYDIFNPLFPFYIIRDLQPTKRMGVIIPSGFELDYDTCSDGFFDIEFLMLMPYFEAVEKTVFTHKGRA